MHINVYLFFEQKKKGKSASARAVTLGLNCKLCLRGTPSTFAIAAWASSHLLLKSHGPWAVPSRQEPSSISLLLLHRPASHQAPPAAVGFSINAVALPAPRKNTLLHSRLVSGTVRTTGHGGGENKSSTARRPAGFPGNSHAPPVACPTCQPPCPSLVAGLFVWTSRKTMSNRAVFSSKNFCKIGIVSLSFVFDKYYTIMY